MPAPAASRPAVFANGVWKSGNNLLIKVCGLMGFPRADLGVAASLLVGRPYPVRRLVRGPRWARSPVSVGLELGVSVSARWLDRRVRRLAGRCFSGHAAYSDGLMDLLRSNGVRPVQIVRDPRDVAVSYAHWIVTRPDFYAHPAFARLDFDARVRAVISGARHGSLRIESLATVLDRSYGWLTRPDEVLVVRFEDLVGARGGGSDAHQAAALERIAKWIEAPVSDLGAVREAAFGGTRTFRKGRVGAWREEMAPETLRLFHQVVGGRLAQWGYRND